MHVCVRAQGYMNQTLGASWYMNQTLGAVLVTTPDLQPSRLGYLTIFRVSPGRHNACMHAPPHSGRWHSSVEYSQPRVHEVSTAADLDGRPQWFPAGVGRSEFFSDPPPAPRMACGARGGHASRAPKLNALGMVLCILAQNTIRKRARMSSTSTDQP